MRRRGRHPLATLLLLVVVAGSLYGLWRVGVRLRGDPATVPPPETASVPVDLERHIGPYEVLRLITDLNLDGRPDAIAISPRTDTGRRIALVLTEHGQYKVAGSPQLLEWTDPLPEVAIQELPSAPRSLLVTTRLPGGEEQFQAFAIDTARGLVPLDYYRLIAPERSERSLVLVDRTLNVLYYYRNGKVAMVARVSTGKDRQGPPAVNNNYTPEGRFRIMVFQKDPSYTSPDGSKTWKGGDPANPLGTRWLGFPVLPGDPGWIFGLHGTSDRTTLGTWSTNGAIRMFNADIEALFHQLQEGTPLEIL